MVNKKIPYFVTIRITLLVSCISMTMTKTFKTDKHDLDIFWSKNFGTHHISKISEKMFEITSKHIM